MDQGAPSPKTGQRAADIEAVCQKKTVLTHVMCGRPLHQTSTEIDPQPVCLMHSRDPAKLSGALYSAFIEEFEATLNRAGDDEATFDQFIFPAVNLKDRTFAALCNFCQAQFAGEASFKGAIFSRVVFFASACFQQEADFSQVKFLDNGDFLNTLLKKKADFSLATFTTKTAYEHTVFKGPVSWERATFLGRALFRSTRFEAKLTSEPRASFVSTVFSTPANISFDSVNLSRVTFIDCDVSQVTFSTSVEWGSEGGRRGLIVEELLMRDESSAQIGFLSIDHRRVSQIYQQLKKNYDSRLAYWAADEFHFGEMEMKRLSEVEYGRLLAVRVWLKRNLGLVALYRWASDYGNNYVKPMLWLLLMLLLFAFLFPQAGIDDKRSERQTYAKTWSSGVSLALNLNSETKLVGKSLLTSVDTATFQRNGEYVPSYPWGRSLAIAETLITSILFALFLLAIRRQFRR